MVMNETQQNQNNIALNDSLFEIFIQECLQAKMQDSQSSNPLYPLITQTRYALTQSTPLHSQNKAIINRLLQDIDKPMKVAIIGQFSSGKSTFLNALLGKEILPSGITPVTAKVCEITYGDEVGLEIHYKNNAVVNKPISYLGEVDEIENLKISYYKLFVPLELLKVVSFLDTPGFNSQNESDTETTNTILESVDGIIWLTLIDNVGKNSEKEILQTHVKRYAHKSLCVLNQKDRLKSEEEINTSIEYAKRAFEGFFEEVIAISAKQALDSINLAQKDSESFFNTGILSSYNTESNNDSTTHSLQTDNKEAQDLFKDSNIGAVLDFIYNAIRPKAIQAKNYRILRDLRTLIVKEKWKLHKINLAYKELYSLLNVFTQKLHFNALQSDLEKSFQKLFGNLEIQFDSIAQKIFNSFELKPFEIVRETKNFIGMKSQITQTKEVNVLPRERLMSELCNNDNMYAREMRKLGFMLSEFGSEFSTFIDTQKTGLCDSLELWRESALQSLSLAYSNDMAVSDGIIERHFRIEVLDSEITNDYKATLSQCVQSLQNELANLAQFLNLNFQNTIMLCLQKLHFEVENALTKHKTNPDTLPLYNPTLENVRDLINLGLHYPLYQEKLSLNFPLYKKTLWQIQQNLTKVYEEKYEVIQSWIDTNKQKYAILEKCELELKNHNNKN